MRHMRVLKLALSAAFIMFVTEVAAESQVSLSPGAILRDCADCPEIVVIPPGAFEMGSDHMEPMRDSESRPEGPIRTVTIDKSFAAGRFEVTKAEYDAFIAATGYTPTNACVTWGDAIRCQASRGRTRAWDGPQQIMNRLSASIGTMLRRTPSGSLGVPVTPIACSPKQNGSMRLKRVQQRRGRGGKTRAGFANLAMFLISPA